MSHQFSDTETVNYLPTAETDNVDVLSDAALSDAETISYLPYLNLRNQIYRKKAKKRALKTLAKKKLEKITFSKKEIRQISQKHVFWFRLKLK